MELFHGNEKYIASPELMQSVNIAMALQKPLLIKGEPGTGKTMLANAISEALNKRLIIWNIKFHTVQFPQKVVRKLRIRLVYLVY